MKPECIFQANDLLGENPTWDWRSQRLFWLDIQRNQLAALDPATNQLRTWSLPDHTSCFALTTDESRLVLAMRRGAYMFDLESNKLTETAPPPYDPARFYMNDGHCDRAGVFIVGSHDTQKKDPLERPSSFYWLDGGVWRPIINEVGVSNGLAFSPDNKILYRSEFREGLILAYDWDSAARRATNRRVFAEIPKGMGMPDGATVDAEGGYWSALFTGGRVVRFNADGKLDREIELSARKPTMLSFGGPDLRTVYVTTASYSAPPFTEVGADAGGIFSFRSDVPGLPEAFMTV
jgi:sugar lactone lactonase YvrE